MYYYRWEIWCVRITKYIGMTPFKFPGLTPQGNLTLYGMTLSLWGKVDGRDLDGTAQGLNNGVIFAFR